jgi:hypothetical protein
MSLKYFEMKILGKIEKRIYEIIDEQICKYIKEELNLSIEEYSDKIHSTLFNRGFFEIKIHDEVNVFINDELDFIFYKIKYCESFFSPFVHDLFEVFFDYHDLKKLIDECLLVKENDYAEILEIKEKNK